MHTASKILGANGQPYRNGHAPNGHAPATRQDLLDLIVKTYDDRARRRRAQAARGDIHAKYDAAQSSPDFDNYWASADAHDADSANSKNVRARLVQCSRGSRPIPNSSGGFRLVRNSGNAGTAFHRAVILALRRILLRNNTQGRPYDEPCQDRISLRKTDLAGN
jgi:hypothetical protein